MRKLILLLKATFLLEKPSFFHFFFAFIFICITNTANAGGWSEPDTYNLICSVDGNLGSQRLVFQVKQARFPLFDSTPRLSLIANGEQSFKIEQANAATLRAKIVGPLPGWPPDTSTIVINVNRITGDIRIVFYPADWQEAPNGIWFRINQPNVPAKPEGTSEERGNCIRAAPIL